mmetsp:Transcript_30030/g.59421  ORF Transcript_30030/g.59421 Transcript_30030/m.59421 type:complete len:512 (+) Transcript_30030:393-1928(+)
MHEVAGHLLIALESDDAEEDGETDSDDDDDDDDTGADGGGDETKKKEKGGTDDPGETDAAASAGDGKVAPARESLVSENDGGYLSPKFSEEEPGTGPAATESPTTSAASPTASQLRRQGALYTLFTAVMDRLRPLYEHDGGGGVNPGRSRRRTTTQLNESCASVLRWLNKADRALSDHLARMDISPQLYCIKWFRLMFSREVTNYYSALELWDNIFMLTTSLPFTAVNSRLRLINVLEVAATAMLLLQRDTIMEGGIDEALICLMRYPPLQDISSLVYVMKCLSNQTVTEAGRTVTLSPRTAGAFITEHNGRSLAFNATKNFAEAAIDTNCPVDIFPRPPTWLAGTVAATTADQRPALNIPATRSFGKRMGGALTSRFSTIAENVAMITSTKGTVPAPPASQMTTSSAGGGQQAAPVSPTSPKPVYAVLPPFKPHHGAAKISTLRDRSLKSTRRKATNLPELALKLDDTVSVLVRFLTGREENNPTPEVWEALAQIQEVAAVLDTAGRSEL